MTKWNLPEGRRPLTDEDMAALTRRLADTAIEHSELYQAAKRDAEEAEAYAEEAEAYAAELVELLNTPNQSDGKLGRYHYDWDRVDAALARITDTGGRKDG